jgi:predicted nucleic acid-binding protein
MEIAHYLVRHFEKNAARRKIEHFVNLRSLKILDFNSKLMAESLESLLEYSYSHGLGGRDSTILATVISQGIEALMTHDAVFKRLSDKISCKIIDPIMVKEN